MIGESRSRSVWLSVAALVVVIGARSAFADPEANGFGVIAQNGTAPSVRMSGPGQGLAERQQSQSHAPTVPEVGAPTKVFSAHYEVPNRSEINAPSVHGGASVGLAAAASEDWQSHQSGRQATPLAPRSSLGLPEAGSDDAAGSRSGGVTSILIALGFVIVLMLGVAKLVHRNNPLAVTGVPRDAIDVLGRRTVDPRNSIYIVRVGPKILLLGNSATGLTTLSEIDDPIEVASLANICRATSERPQTDLVAWLMRLVGRRPASGDSSSFEDRFGERLMTDAQQGEDGTVTSVSVAPRREARRV
jgi:flagellar biogenesis protein FliO